MTQPTIDSEDSGASEKPQPQEQVGGKQVVKRYEVADKHLWEWLVKYGYNHLPNDKSLKKDKMWQEFWPIWREIDQLKSDIHEAHDHIITEVAREILAPHNINLDEILNRYFS